VGLPSTRPCFPLKCDVRYGYKSAALEEEDEEQCPEAARKAEFKLVVKKAKPDLTL